MLYTRKGDGGQTGLFGCCQKKVSKSATVVEALGAVDELNSFLGVVKMTAEKATAKILTGVQQDLFIVQAELAGAKKSLTKEKVIMLERMIDATEKKLPPITTFVVAGGTARSAQLDYARAVTRRVERRVSQVKISAATRAYLNRLSSLLYALARLTNHKAGIEEAKPSYR